LKRMPELEYGVSATTRRPRPGEEDGRNYFFLTDEEFDDWVREGRFVEWSDVYGARYGTPREPMESLLRSGVDVVVEKDVRGASILMERYADASFVFVVPPSMAELRRRIASRAAEPPEAARRRLERTRPELEQADRYDYVVVNDDLSRTVDRLEAIITAERCRAFRQEHIIELLCAEEE